MSSTPRAAFDVPLDPRDRSGRRLRGAFHDAPATTLVATTTADVPGVVTAAERAAVRGHWVVGTLAYEAGSAWDRAQRTRAPRGPLAWFEIHSGPPEPWDPGLHLAPEPRSRPRDAPDDDADPDWFVDGRFSTPTPAGAIAAAIRHIEAGDCYQVNLTGRLTAMAPVAATADDRAGRLHAFASRLASRQPGGYLFHLAGPGIACVSPELFFHRHADGRVVTQPMKGTAPLADPGRLDSEKEHAENLMIVDLLRNDLGRVCRPGTVTVEGLFERVELPTVWQQVSTVSGLAPGVSLNDLLGALFPCGSVTGAPKIPAMDIIAGLEARPRGWYCGAVMVIRPGGETIAAVPIRTVEQDGPWLHCGVGSGIVADSDPAAELAEWRSKAVFLGGTTQRALETMHLRDGSYPLADRHLGRLRRTSEALGLGVRMDEVTSLMTAEARRHPSGDHRVRITADEHGAIATVTPLPRTPVPAPLILAGAPLDQAALAPVLSHKTTYRAHLDAVRAAAPPEAFDVICYTADGWVTECTLGNIAIERDGRWVTPPASRGLLPGTRRAALLASGDLVEADVHIDELATATGIAFLNGTRGWIPGVLLTR